MIIRLMLKITEILRLIRTFNCSDHLIFLFPTEFRIRTRLFPSHLRNWLISDRILSFMIWSLMTGDTRIYWWLIDNSNNIINCELIIFSISPFISKSHLRNNLTFFNNGWTLIFCNGIFCGKVWRILLLCRLVLNWLYLSWFIIMKRPSWLLSDHLIMFRVSLKLGFLWFLWSWVNNNCCIFLYHGWSFNTSSRTGDLGMIIDWLVWNYALIENLIL